MSNSPWNWLLIPFLLWGLWTFIAGLSTPAKRDYDYDAPYSVNDLDQPCGPGPVGDC